MKNAEYEGFILTKKEKNAIRSHMFPLAVHIPTSRLAVTVSIADKIVAMREYAMNLIPAAHIFHTHPAKMAAYQNRGF